MPRSVVRVLLPIAFALAAACGDPEVAEPTGPAGPPATGAVGETAETDGPALADEAPDACSLIDTDQLGSILGSDPGAGAPAGGGERTVCLFGSGLILAVEVAGNYEASKAAIEDMRPITSVEGLGNEAFWDGAGQLIALGDAFFVAVTLGAGDETELIEQGTQILTVMLGNL